MDRESLETIEAFKNIKSSFNDYVRFEDAANKRAIAQSDFMEWRSYVPYYEYPKLDSLLDKDKKGMFLQDTKTRAYHAVLELEAHKDSGYMPTAEFELYASFHETRLKKIMLVEASRRMRLAATSSEQHVARQNFLQLNTELYGEFDEPAFEGMMNTEQTRVHDFQPGNTRAAEIKASLSSYFAHHVFESEEKPLLEKETFATLSKTVQKRYEHILSAVPDTEPGVYYDAQQAQEIMQRALELGGLSEKGWVIKIDEDKSNPATDAEKQKISLPSNLRRNANELRRLIVHEQEVHGRRGQNGKESGILPLEMGTAEYADVEEGFGVLLECLIAGSMDNPSFHRARERYLAAGLALGIDGSPRDARQTYEVLWQLLALQGAADGVVNEQVEKTAKAKAMKHVENAFRGTDFAMPGVIYSKLKVYYEGLKKNADYFSAQIGDIERAFDDALLGKYNHTDQTEASHVQQLVAA